MKENNKYALITGGTSGIGYELARLFAKDHYNLVIVARNTEELTDIAIALTLEFGIDVIPISKDLVQRETPLRIYEELRNRQIPIEILVNDTWPS